MTVYLGRLLMSAFFLNAPTLGNSQGLVSDDAEKVKLLTTEVLEPMNSRYNAELLINIWLDQEQGQLEKSFGLRYKPNDDQNVYLLCNYEVGKSRAEVGLSLNNFTAMTITYGHRLSFNDLTK